MSMLVIHALIGFFTDVPAWKMFRKIERWSYEIQDVDGVPINIRDHVPRRGVHDHGTRRGV